MDRPPEPAWRRQLLAIAEVQIARYPLLVQLRALYAQIREERPSWPVLLPALAVLFVLFYRQERARLARRP